MNNPFQIILIFLFLTLLLPACDDAGGSDIAFESATQDEIASCKEACNQLKFFECNNSVEHALCFQNCEAASGSQVELFTSCVFTDVCDATCSPHIEPIEPPTVVEPTSCETVCEEFAIDCFEGATESCVEVCAPSTAGLALYCLSRRTGCNFPPECIEGNGTILDPPNPTDDCMDACDKEAFFGCISATDVSACYGLCEAGDESSRSAFTVCAQVSVSCDTCYEQFGGTSSVDVAGCQAACDQLSFFECIDPSTLASCRSLCSSSRDGAAVDTFIACTQGLCSDDSCVELLVVPPTSCPELACASNETCVGGLCVADQPTTCPTVPCASNETCVDGSCVADQPTTCPTVPCASNETCVGGSCVADQPAECSNILCGVSEIC